MPSIGARCHELRIVNARIHWRIIFRIDHDAIIILEVFRKTTQQTPVQVINTCKTRIKHYDNA